MANEDYFGEVQVPLNEEDEDAANDLTFGDIGDINAGDESSDALWKPDHQTLSSKIEAEKEALSHIRNVQAGSPQQTTAIKVAEGRQTPNHFSQFGTHRYVSGSQPQPQPLAGQEQSLPPNQYFFMHGQQRQIPQRPQQQAMRVPHPAMRAKPVLGGEGSIAQLPQRPNLQPQVNPEEYERAMVEHHEQQARELLRRHKETAEQQLREAEAAQRAGVLFDRNKFDEHQNAMRQRIITDYHARVNQLRYMLWHQKQQMLQRAVHTPEQHIVDTRTNDTLAHLAEGSSASQSHNSARNSDVYSNGNTTSAYRSQRQTSLNGSHHNTFQTTGNSLHVQKDRERREVELAPRMLEIERQMAEAGLGPSRSKSNNRKQFELSSKEPVELPLPRKSGQRRLESMTDKDQELVFRVHLRQVESSVAYKDDFYYAVKRNKEKVGENMFSDLADEVHSIRERTRQRGGEGRPTRARRSKRSNAQSGDQVVASPPHSDHNLKALANALGTVQSWNPRAPRRVMDFGMMEKKSPPNLNDPVKLLRDDERVHVRQEVERGYDIIAAIHDIARGESTESLEAQVKALIETLHLDCVSDRGKRIDENSGTSARYFGAMCVIEKGRRYLTRVMELLDAGEKVRVMPAIFGNLGAIIFALQKETKLKAGGQCNLFKMMFKTLQDPDVMAEDYLKMMATFTQSHVSHRDAFLTTFRSAAGSKLIFLCMQRVSRGVHKSEIDNDGLLSIEKLSETFTGLLQDIFEGAESVGRVWEVTASLDGLATGEHRERYRAELNRLLRSGAVPPPPGVQ